MWDASRGAAMPFDTPAMEEALEGRHEVDAIEIGADDEVLADGRLAGETAFSKLVAHMKPYSPEWAQGICDVPAPTMRRIALEYIDHARVGETIDIEGERLPYRPVSVSLGKTVNNGWGGFECVWARTMLAAVVGGLEVPGGTLGTTVRLNRQAPARIDTVTAGPDGFMDYPLNPTDKARWSPHPNIRNAYRTMVPLAANGPWSQALGPTHFSWMFLDETPKGLPRVTLPDVWFVYRTNPAISFWDTGGAGRDDGALPVHGRVRVHAGRDQPPRGHPAPRGDRPREPAADQDRRVQVRRAVLALPGLRAPAARGRHARRSAGLHRDRDRARDAHGLLDKYNASINKGAAGVPLKGPHWDFALEPGQPHAPRGDLGRRVPRGERGALRRQGRARAGMVEGARARDEAVPADRWYLFPTLVARGCASSCPTRSGCGGSAPSSAGGCTSTTCTGGTSS